MTAPKWPWVAFGLLCAGFLIGFLVFPTYPNYDSYYSLLWGRELLDGEPLSFTEHRAPTQHPLAIVVGALLSLLGTNGDRAWIAMILAAFVGLVWGLYRLGRDAFTPLVGGLAGLLLVSRFDYPFLAARGYIDVPYLTLIIWAAVVEARAPRRGTTVLVLLALAGMLRPEAWVLAAGYWLWLVAGRRGLRVPLRRAASYAVLAALGPVVWAAVDLAVTGDPLFSLTYTSGSAEDLGRQRTLGELPTVLPEFFAKLVKAPVLLASVLGIGLSVLLTPRRTVMPLVLLLSGIGTFFMIGVAGLSVIDRYLIAAALALLIFAAVALGGFTLLEPGTRWRRVWAVGALLIGIYGVLFSVTRVNPERLRNELVLRGDIHASLEQVLNHPRVRAAVACGPVTLPNHKAVPDTRWILDLGADAVLARSDLEDRRTRATRGVAVVAVGRLNLFRSALSNPADSPLVNLAPPGFERVVTSVHYAAYVKC